MNPKRKKFLFLYLKTGSGHLSPARSVANYILKNKNEEAEVQLIDGFEKTKKFARFIVEDGYRILQSKAKWIYELIYAVHKFELISHISALLVSINTKKYLEDTILSEKPDKILIFHFFLIKPVYDILKEYNLNIKVFTVVTDPYIAHPIWFLRKDQNFIVFSEKLKARRIKRGVETKRLSVFPFILDEKFSIKTDNEEINMIKNKLGFAKENVLLILGGGDGIPKGIPILKQLLKTNNDFEIAFVCGKNKKMFEKAVHIKETGNVERLKVYGFIDFVSDLLSISEVVITKCGASTFMEILISGKVPIVNSYIWEQEKGNVDFIVENELGIFERRIRKLPQIILEMFSEKEVLQKYKTNIEHVKLQNGTAQVAEFILS